MASLMAGCGIRWTSVPFLDYDSTFKGLKNPPLFRWEGPDGSQVRVVLDAWASRKANYMQGGYLLKEPIRATSEWIPHYAGLGAAYPLRTLFASGTHSDINPASWKQTRGFSESIIRFNADGTNAVKLVNGTLAQFCAEVDAAEAQSPFLPTLRGGFGQSWQLWPVSLARTVAALRENERSFLAAESLITIAAQGTPDMVARTRNDRERAEWYWAMLSDHAWNGADLKNARHNAALRADWADHLGQIGQHLDEQAWMDLGLVADSRQVTVFNPLSFTRDFLVECAVASEVNGVKGRPSEVYLDHAQRRVVFVATGVPAFGFSEYKFETKRIRTLPEPPFTATPTTLESPFLSVEIGPGERRSRQSGSQSQRAGVGGRIHRPLARTDGVLRWPGAPPLQRPCTSCNRRGPRQIECQRLHRRPADHERNHDLRCVGSGGL